MDLQQKKILVTRAKAQASALSLQIEKNNGIPVLMPLINCVEKSDKMEIVDTINTIGTYDWLVFTSKNGIDFFMKEACRTIDVAKLQDVCKIAVVGKKTEDALGEYGLCADALPEQFVAESLLEKLLEVVTPGERVLIPKGNLAREVIAKGLRANGVEVTELEVYDTVIDESSRYQLYAALRDGEIDVVTFTSSSTVNNFVQLLQGTNWESYCERVIFVSIGPITSETMAKHGVRVDVEAKEFTLQGMLYSLSEKLKEEIEC